MNNFRGVVVGQVVLGLHHWDFVCCTFVNLLLREKSNDVRVSYFACALCRRRYRMKQGIDAP